MKTASVFLILACCTATPAWSAQDDNQALAACLVDSLNGKERKQLAKWIYFAMAAHPEMGTYANIPQADRTATDRHVGQLVTRLLADDCAQQLVTAQSKDPMAAANAFQFVGQMAMQELMASPEVQQAITSYVEFTDQDRINALFSK